MSTKTVAEVWVFKSSKGDRTYQSLLYTDDTTSCDCPGWTRRVANNGSRSCKHTRSIDCGSATHDCEKHHVYVTKVAVNEPVVNNIRKLNRREV